MTYRNYTLCLLGFFLSSCASPQEDQPIVLRGGTLIDGTGRAPIANAVVVIEGQHIVAIGNSNEVSVPENARIIDTQNKWIIPGLIDAHAHFGTGFVPGFNIVTPDPEVRREIARNFLRYGVTTIFVMADDPELVLSDKKQITEGSMVGPRIFTAGPAFTFPGSHPAQVATAEMPLALASADPEEMKRMVREVANKGVDFIKIAVEADIPRPGGPRMPAELIEVVVEEAHRNDLRVGCHCTSVDEATDAVRAGVDVLIHWVRSDHGPITPEFIDLLQSNDVFVIPTMGVYNAASRYTLHPETVDDQDFVAFAGRQVIDEIKTDPGWEAWSSMRDFWQSAAANVLESVKKLYQSGVTLGFGTDTSVRLVSPGYSVAFEMDLMRRIGMQPMDILVAATQTNSRIWGLQNQIGVLAPGKLADLVILESNPLEDVYNIRTVFRVLKDGKIYDPDAMATDLGN